VPSTDHQPPQIAHVNASTSASEAFGDANAEPMLLIMGLGAQMIHWDDEFCRQLAARGFRVIRFDNRDIGKSSKMSGGKRLTAVELLKLRFLKIPVAAPYKLRDMAQDTIALMDALRIRSAHIAGASMGGMIAQEIAIKLSRTGALADLDHVDDGQSKIPPPTREASAVLMAPPPVSKEEYFAASPRPGKSCAAGSFPRTRRSTPRAPRAPGSAASTARRWPPAPRHPRLRSRKERLARGGRCRRS